MAGGQRYMTLAGRVIVVTGGSRGIGRACVLRAVALGAQVVFCSRTDGPESREVEAAASGSRRGGAAIGVAADVSDEAAVMRVFETARRRFGMVHGVVSNAAVVRDELLVSATTEEWDEVIGANLTGGFLVVREAVRTFLDQGGCGRIVAIGSLSQHGVSGNASYAVSKGGLEGLAREITWRYAELGIAFNVVVPGYIETKLTSGMSDTSKFALIDGCPMRRAGSADEVASVVTYLLSDAAQGLDAQAIYASGGLREVPR
jgi:3-oxoacyl-[acyl-carrier protein] reductase